MKDFLLSVAAVLIAGLVVGGIGLLVIRSGDVPNVGSVNQGNSYHSTTTRNLAAGVTKITSSTTELGSVTITSSSNSQFWILDWDGKGTVADSSTIIAYFPSLPTVGTYIFDLILSKGLYVSSTPANAGNYVVSYR